MKAKDLRNSVLQLAIQGKLVLQDSNDEPASVLLERIKAEKEDLINEKKIKKQKLLPPILEDELPFDIPESWEWVRLGEICVLLNGASYEGLDLPLLNANYFRKRGEVTYKNKGKYAARMTYVILVDGENSGEVFYVSENGLLGSTFKMLDINSNCFAPFFIYLLKYYQDLFRYSKRGAAIPHLDKALFRGLPIGLPCHAEQQRIVAKLEQIMPLIDEYEKLETKLTKLEIEFPDKLKKSILQYAVQGKLVEQNPNDKPTSELLEHIKVEKDKLIKEKKTRKQKPLASISEDEVPFDIPDSWEWVRLIDILLDKPRNGNSPNGVNYETDTKVLTLTATTKGKLDLSSYKNVEKEYDSNSYLWLKHGDILIQRSNSDKYIGTACLYDSHQKGYTFPDLMMKIQIVEPILTKYIVNLLQSPFVKNYFRINASGTSDTMKKITQGIVSNVLIPLPPLEEQQRIVDKVDKLLSLCDVISDEKALKDRKVKRIVDNVIEFSQGSDDEDTEIVFAARGDANKSDSDIAEEIFNDLFNDK